jgi:MYXO-CTERM domain-containing protein
VSRAITAGLAIFAAASAARAQECGSPDLRSAFPPDGADGVPIDASVSAVYAETADYLGEPVTITDAAGTRPLDVTFDPSERRLIARDAGLAASSSYTIAWPPLRGLSTAGHGSGATVTFTTGTEVDSLAPTFAGVTRLRGDLNHIVDECTDEPEPRMTFDFTLGAADDDGGRESLALLVFQTQGSLLTDGAPKLVALTGWPEDSKARVELPVDGATGHVCFAAAARDLVDRISATTSVEHCVDLAEPPFFYGYGCSFSAARQSAAGWFALGVFLWISGRRRRR